MKNKNNWFCSYVIEYGSVIDSKYKYRKVESSSTIKIIILILIIEKINNGNIHYLSRLRIRKKHLSNGSGILNWTNIKKISILRAMRLTAKYSDCVATNLLIDHLGGKEEINKKLQEYGFKTSLNMEMIKFDDIEYIMPSVGTTTAEEMMRLFKLLFEQKKVLNRVIIRYVLKNIDTSWFEVGTGHKINNLYHKTGSMIDIGDNHDTIFNVVGAITTRSGTIYFTFFSRGNMNSSEDISQVRKKLSQELSNKIYIISRRLL